MTVLLREQTGNLRQEQPRLRHHLLTRLRADRLTRQLAGGAAPESSMLLALRAQRLVAQPFRRALAAELAVLVATGQSATRPREWPVDWPGVGSALEDLHDLQERLGRAGPVGVRGVALVELLLRDGAGPLYYPGGPGELVADARAASAALEPVAG